jgi:hypothetical protein
VAIERAAGLGVPNASFEVASFDEWEPRDRFDVVVLNEVVLEAVDPARLALRALGWLSARGVLLISVFRDPASHHRRFWEAIAADGSFEVLDSTVVTNRQRLTWDVAAFRQRTVCRESGLRQ